MFKIHQICGVALLRVTCEEDFGIARGGRRSPWRRLQKVAAGVNRLDSRTTVRRVNVGLVLPKVTRPKFGFLV
jgi:hypothetical protein